MIKHLLALTIGVVALPTLIGLLYIFIWVLLNYPDTAGLVLLILIVGFVCYMLGDAILESIKR